MELTREEGQTLSDLFESREWELEDNLSPNKYTLGKGHIRFFSNKAIFLSRRLSELVEEQKRRGFKHSSVFDLNELPQESLNDWNPTEEAIKINLNRIFEKIKAKPSQWKYKSQSIKLNDYYSIVSQKYKGLLLNVLVSLESLPKGLNSSISLNNHKVK